MNKFVEKLESTVKRFPEGIGRAHATIEGGAISLKFHLFLLPVGVLFAPKVPFLPPRLVQGVAGEVGGIFISVNCAGYLQHLISVNPADRYCSHSHIRTVLQAS